MKYELQLMQMDQDDGQEDGHGGGLSGNNNNRIKLANYLYLYLLTAIISFICSSCCAPALERHKFMKQLGQSICYLLPDTSSPSISSLCWTEREFRISADTAISVAQPRCSMFDVHQSNCRSFASKHKAAEKICLPVSIERCSIVCVGPWSRH